MKRNLPKQAERNRIARAPKRPGTRPRALAMKAIAAHPPSVSPSAFAAARAMLIARITQRLIDRGVLVVENGVAHVRKP